MNKNNPKCLYVTYLGRLYDKDSDDESIDSVDFAKRPVGTTTSVPDKAKAKAADDSGDESETDWGSSDDDSSLSSDDHKYEGNLPACFLKQQQQRERKKGQARKDQGKEEKRCRRR